MTCPTRIPFDATRGWRQNKDICTDDHIELSPIPRRVGSVAVFLMRYAWYHRIGWMNKHIGKGLRGKSLKIYSMLRRKMMWIVESKGEGSCLRVWGGLRFCRRWRWWEVQALLTAKVLSKKRRKGLETKERDNKWHVKIKCHKTGNSSSNTHLNQNTTTNCLLKTTSIASSNQRKSKECILVSNTMTSTHSFSLRHPEEPYRHWNRTYQ